MSLPYPTIMVVSLALLCVGCQTQRKQAVNLADKSDVIVAQSPVSEASSSTVTSVSEPEAANQIQLTAMTAQAASPASPQPGSSTIVPTPDIYTQQTDELTSKYTLPDIINSVYAHYPLLRSAMFSRNVATGEYLSAQGNFDTKLKAETLNQPLGFYETYRHNLGITQPIYEGGDFFAGYRAGRGQFEPWYLERETNEGGEFKAGVVSPLLRNREIDERRSELWKANYGRQLVEPEIQAQLISFVQDSSYAYWDWVAAGQVHHLAENILRLATERTDRIKTQVDQGLVSRLDLSDNLRLVQERKAKLADADRKLQQTTIKLSQYLRNPAGDPIILTGIDPPPFPPATLDQLNQLEQDLQLALNQRPELSALNLIQRQLQVDYAQAENDLLPNLNALVSGSQDIGLPTSSKRDKSQFELEAGLQFDVPVQRRKAQGKLQSLEGKFVQLRAKRQITQDKIAIEVRAFQAALINQYQQIQETLEAVKYADELAERERLNYANGASDILKITLREQYSFEAREKLIDAQQQFFKSQADYRAALAQDRLQ